MYSQEDLTNMMRSKNTLVKDKNILKVLIAEFQRQPYKELTIVETRNIIKSMIKNSKLVLDNCRTEEEKIETIYTINFLSSLLPAAAVVDEEQVKAWIQDNIDFSTYKNKMQAMKPILAHFGASVEGSVIKNILSAM